MSRKYIAVIPAYKPPKIILAVIAQPASSGFEVIDINDGGPFGIISEAEITAEELLENSEIAVGENDEAGNP